LSAEARSIGQALRPVQHPKAICERFCGFLHRDERCGTSLGPNLLVRPLIWIRILILLGLTIALGMFWARNNIGARQPAIEIHIRTAFGAKGSIDRID